MWGSWLKREWLLLIRNFEDYDENTEYLSVAETVRSKDSDNMQIKKKYIYIALGLWALVTVTYFTLCKIASDQAMLIFNKTMSAQKVLKAR